VRKTFDAVDWMRTRRAKIDQEDQTLSWEEKHKRTHRLLETDPLWKRLKNRIVETTSSPLVTITKRREKRGDHQEKIL